MTWEKNQSGVLHLTQKVEFVLQSIARVEKLGRNVESSLRDRKGKLIEIP